MDLAAIAVNATPEKNEIVSWKTSPEWLDMWGYLPDPDPILLKLGVDVRIFDQLLGDPHVFACYQSRKAGILTSEYDLQFPKGSESRKDFYESVFKNLPMDEVISQILDAPFYGFSVSEIMWNLSDGKWVPIRVEQKPNDWFVWHPDGSLRYLSMKDQINGEKLPPGKFLVSRYFPTYKNPYGIRTLSRCFWPVTFKRAAYKYWTMFLQKYGVPWAIGKVPPGTETTRRTELLTMLTEMINSGVAVINDDESIELVAVKINSSGTDSIYEAKANACNGEISKAILTQTLTTEVGTKGAYAASQSHLSIRTDLCSMDKKLVSRTLTQLCALLNHYNFRDDAYPFVRFVEEDDDKEPQSRRDSQLSTQGVRFKPSYYQRAYNLRRDEFTLKDPDEVKKSQEGVPGETDREKNRKKAEDRKEERKKGEPDKAKKESK